jgi:hypothetical protein
MALVTQDYVPALSQKSEAHLAKLALIAGGPPPEPRSVLPTWQEAKVACLSRPRFVPEGEILEGASFLPQRRLEAVPGGGLIVDGGVFRADGEPCLRSLPFSTGFVQFPRAQQDQTPSLHMPGTSLFAGLLHPHFGQFLVHSLARLWAVHDSPVPIDRIVFSHFVGHRNVGDPARSRKWADHLQALPFVRDLLPLLVGNIPFRVVSTPTTFERLIVPMPLTSHDVFEVTPAVRNLWRHLAGRVDALTELPRTDEFPDAAAIYLSRSALRLPASVFVLEDRLEANLREAGYVTFHPQQHPLATQLRVMRRAERIIAAEGSALHLLAMVARPEQRIAVVLRRPGFGRFVRQLRAAGAVHCEAVDAVAGRLRPVLGDHPGSGVTDPNTPATLDFHELRDALLRLRFIGDTRWDCPSDAETIAAVADLGARWPRKKNQAPWRFEMVPPERPATSEVAVADEGPSPGPN